MLRFVAVLGYHLPNSPWPGIIQLFPASESLLSDISAGDEKIANLFYSVGQNELTTVNTECQAFCPNIRMVPPRLHPLEHVAPLFGSKGGDTLACGGGGGPSSNEGTNTLLYTVIPQPFFNPNPGGLVANMTSKILNCFLKFIIHNKKLKKKNCNPS
jgi:hypothetical protein